jgi:hypothetical protein
MTFFTLDSKLNIKPEFSEIKGWVVCFPAGSQEPKEEETNFLDILGNFAKVFTNQERRSTMAFSTDSTLGEILDNEKGKAVLEKHMPGVSKDPRTAMGRGMTLKQIAAFMPAQITPALLQAIDEDLKKI